MGFLNTNSMPRLVEKLSDGSNIKITGNSKGNRVGTVIKKIVEKADEVTKAVEQEIVNDNYSFKVGTGDVDVSSDVQDGFGEVGIKGVTYQNLLGKYFIGSGSNDYISIESEKIKFNKPQTGSNISIRYPDALVQPSKTYTLMFYVYKNTLQREDDSLVNVAKFNIVSYNTGLCHIPKNTTGLIKAVLHQPSTVTGDGKPYLEVYGSCFGELEISYPVLLEGDHTNNPNLPSYFEGIVGVGDKSKNLFNPKEAILGYVDSTGGFVEVVNNIRTNYLLIKPNTPYIGMSQGASKLNNYSWFDKNKTFIKRDSMEGYAISPNNAMYLIYHNQYCAIGSVVDLSSVKIQLEEGTVSTPYEPYYDGHKIEILSNSKNLFKSKNWNYGKYINASDGVIRSDDDSSYCEDYFEVSPLTTYTCFSKFTINKYIYFYDANYKYLGFVNRNSTDFVLTTPSSCKYVRVGLLNTIYFKDINDLELTFSEGDNLINYEPYQEDKTQILLDEPLMQLPNGVCDEITRDGKLIRRVGKVVLDGSEDWRFNLGGLEDRVNTKQFFTPIYDSSFKTNVKIDDIHCDKFAKGEPYREDRECIGLYNGNSRLRIAHKSTTVTEFKAWLEANPTTVYYELSTPIITELPAPYLRIFKDGHLTFNTLVAPTSTHVVQLNKSAQIERSIREVQSLDSRVGKLESFYDDMILETSHKLNLLNFDFDYMRNTEEEI